MTTVILFTAKSINGYLTMIQAVKAVCERYRVPFFVALIEEKSWMYPHYDVTGIPCLVLAENEKTKKKAMGVMTETAVEDVFNEWGLKHVE